jgi:hypothetical protein
MTPECRKSAVIEAPQKRPLLDNDPVYTLLLKLMKKNRASIANHCIGKQAWSAIEDIGYWAIDVFSERSVPKCYKGQRRSFVVSRISSASSPGYGHGSRGAESRNSGITFIGCKLTEI